MTQQNSFWTGDIVNWAIFADWLDIQEILLEEAEIASSSSAITKKVFVELDIYFYTFEYRPLGADHNPAEVRRSLSPDMKEFWMRPLKWDWPV